MVSLNAGEIQKKVDRMDHLYFVESPLFTEQLVEFGVSDEDLSKLQQSIIQNPECGDMIVGTGGAMKTRIPMNGHGKSGGGRVIYYFKSKPGMIYFLLMYSKTEFNKLPRKYIITLKFMVEQIKSGDKGGA